MPNIKATGYNNKIDNLSKKQKDLIYDLRINKNMSYPKMSKVTGLCTQILYKYIKTHLNPTYNPALITRQQKALLGNKWSQKYTAEDVKLVLDDLYHFAVESDNIMIGRYIYRNYGKTPDWLESLKLQFPFLKTEINKIKQLIAEKIRDKGIQGKYNVSFARDVIEELDEEYLALQKERANRSKPETPKDQVLNINLTNYSKEAKESKKIEPSETQED